MINTKKKVYNAADLQSLTHHFTLTCKLVKDANNTQA